MPSIKIKEHEPFDVAIRRFKRACEKAGVMSTLRKKEFYEKPTAKRKRKLAASKKRNTKRIRGDYSYSDRERD
jgi:small subunit ribosomal protein S21